MRHKKTIRRGEKAGDRASAPFFHIGVKKQKNTRRKIIAAPKVDGISKLTVSI
jgi:hypothetical protein